MSTVNVKENKRVNSGKEAGSSSNKAGKGGQVHYQQNTFVIDSAFHFNDIYNDLHKIKSLNDHIQFICDYMYYDSLNQNLIFLFDPEKPFQFTHSYFLLKNNNDQGNNTIDDERSIHLYHNRFYDFIQHPFLPKLLVLTNIYPISI